ncbi:Endoglucanase-4 [Colletotrichum higginsianum IMI 349063]|uniref:lytic cellulose monooxygenase (C4-dehydrogenating) n=2 Tax=Colletotrichum higginsianum TaxID=80884 RepID=A0A1B7Y5F6_COLHI|nr:Endoglucanase-4 [Colletotrichum higginsianum IMI 349063]OBR07279.1 Endoglucanase-4 [Colletotrichum higginsianum IMI 349063]TIC92472.1 Endoglucanase-4 [Colletotrichum higginsianum]
MPSFKNSVVLSALAGAASVMAHGHVNYFNDGAEKFEGYDVTKLPYQNPAPDVYGWANGATDNGFVAPSAYTGADIICHRDSKNAALTAKVAAGDKLQIFWDTWPESHKGPVIDYLASCGDDCSTVDKTSLEFFKIQEAGLTSGSWASDELIAKNFSWEVTIPTSLKPGKYVWRHEIIALHSAGQEDGAQNYPQCLNIEVTGSGSELPAGTKGTSLYTPTDAGILVSIYNNLDSYEIPGPKLPAAFGGSGSGSGSSAAPAPTSTAAPVASAPAVTSAPAAATTTAAAEAAVTSAPASAQQPAPTGGATAPTCEEKRRRRLARRMARQHARDVVRRV